MRHRHVPLVVLLAVVAGVPLTARAAGPPLLGGEDKVIYKGKVGVAGEFRVEMDAGTDTVTQLWLNVPRAARCVRNGRSVRRDHVGLINKPFHVGRSRHVVKTLRAGVYRGDRERYDLRFDAAWTKVTLKYSTHFRHNYLGRCTAKIRVVAPHQPPAKHWQLGRYTGTTAQSLPISWTAAAHSRRAGAWTYTDFLVRDLRVTVAFTCGDGFTATRELAPDLSNETGSGLSVTDGTLAGRLTPGGVAQDTLSGRAEQLWADLSASMADTRASGTITPQGEHVAANATESSSCSGQPISFTASRTG